MKMILLFTVVFFAFRSSLYTSKWYTIMFCFEVIIDDDIYSSSCDERLCIIIN
jgi:hypothetical protein